MNASTREKIAANGSAEDLRIALVCQSIADLKEKLSLVEQAYNSGKPYQEVIPFKQLRNIYFPASREI